MTAHSFASEIHNHLLRLQVGAPSRIRLQMRSLMTCAFKWTPIMASRTLWTLAIIGFATWGIVYVPIPAWRHAVCRPQMYWDAVRFHILDNRQVVLNCHFSSREKRNWQYSNSRMEQDKLENRTGKKLGRSGDETDIIIKLIAWKSRTGRELRDDD